MARSGQAAVGYRRRLADVPAALLLLTVLWARGAGAAPSCTAIPAMVAQVMPAVVRIATLRPDPRNASKIINDVGAGYIIDPSGYVGTNKHLIEHATSVFVTTADGVRHRAQVVGMTAQADIALLRIDTGSGGPLPIVRFGNSDAVRIGDRVVAIGSPLGLNNSVTAGIVSAINRDIKESPFDDYLQTDAAINHGNSGGPLFNMSGEVVGMASAIFSPDRGSSGLGFAIPSNNLKFVFDRLAKTGKVAAGMLPIHTQPVTWGLQQAFKAPDLQGALVTAVDSSEISRAGTIQAGDVIVAFNGQKVLDPRDLARRVARAPVGSDTVLDLVRGGRTETVRVKIQPLPEAKPIQLNTRPTTLGLDLTTGAGENGEPGVQVAAVAPFGTAAEAGIQQGDTLLEIQQTPVSQVDQAVQVLRSVNQPYAAVLVRHKATLSWLALQMPN